MSYFCKTSTPMRREENQPPRPTAGFWSVPLFNHKKRNRIPLTSAPSENEFFSHTEYMESTGLDTSNSTSGTYGYDDHSSAPPQQYGSNRPAPGPVTAARHYAPVSHPYKGGGTGYKMLQHDDPVGQQESSFITNSRQSDYQTPYNRAPIKSASHSGFSQMGQKSLRPPGSTQCQLSRPLPGSLPSANRPFVQTVQPQNSWNSRKFTNSFGSRSSSSEGNRGTNQTQKSIQKKVQEKTKPAVENSLRILTAVIDGMRHWSKFKDRVPNLFEIFATLDSAVTLGHHGAKNFLMRDGKETVQCVFYENEKELPRLIRGQLHRCVGNYDCRRDVLMCVSVRPSLPSELRNAQEAVKVCDAEMRMLVKSLSEV